MHKIITSVFAFLIALSSMMGFPVYREETGNTVIACEQNGGFVYEEEQIILSFESQNVNTAEITFENEAFAEVRIYNGDELIYHRNSSDAYRFCAFPTVTTDSIAIEITGDAILESLKISLRQSDNTDFRVTSYFVSSDITQEGSVDARVFNVITDAIIFGCVTFNENGIVSVNESLLEPALENIRKAVGERDVNVYFNILGPGCDSGISDWYDQMSNQAQKHSDAFASGELENGIVSLIEKYGFDGVFFDYEYPIENKYWRDFNRFLVKLNKATDKKIGVAISEWDMGLNFLAMRSVDLIEVMQYDRFDAEGNHSSFTAAVNGFKCVRDNLIPREKADLGVPFYGRPANADAYWPPYSQYASELNENDYAQTEYGKAYFNSCQTIYDKTAYALSRGFGGMMVWHYSCDADYESGYSLFKSMYDCIADRI